MLRNSSCDAVPPRWLGSTVSGGWRARPRRWLASAAETTRLWMLRSRTRKHLATLNAHQLADIGLRRTDALDESAKPFWQP